MNMKIELRERQNHRFIYVNPANNTVHLIMPIVGGQTIATDNTCQTLAALNHFFGAQPLSSQKSALCELTEYKKELEHDIALIEDGPLKQGKTERLAQINVYIELVTSVLAHPQTQSLGGFAAQYPQPLQALLQQPNRNLFSMRLRPRHVDNFRNTIAPTFTVDPHTATGLYSALHTQFAGINGIPVVTPTERLVQAVMAAIPAADRQAPFNDAKIRHMATICAQQAQRLFGQDMDFQRNTSGAVIDLAYFTNTLATLSADPAQHTAADLSDIVDGIIQSAVSNLDTQTAASPFHVSHIETDEAKERLSIITQFFLAQTNIYCVAKSLTPPGVNFGTILDGNAALSRGVAVCVATSLANNQPVEDALLDFVANTPAFQLRAGANTFTAVRRQEIKQRFNSQFNTIQGSPHFDEFMVLEQTRSGPFTEHQGAICVDFKDLVKELRIQPQDAATWSLRHADTFGLNPEGLAILPHQNPQIEVVCVELTAAKLNARIQGYLRQPATLDTLAEFLLTDVITGSHAGPAAAVAGETRQKLFATLDQQTINLITSSSHWGALRTLITAKTTQELRLAFEQQFQCVDVDVVLTEQMLHALYIQVIRDSEPTPELCNMTYIDQSRLEQHILPILRQTYPALAQGGRIKRSANPPYSLVLECPTPEYARTITTIARENTGFMYVSPQIARAVYLEATARFGEGWDTVGGRRLDNARGPNKLTHALNLLAIPSGDATFPCLGRSSQGYILRATHDSIQRLQQLSYSHPQFIISPQLERQLYAYAETRAGNRQALAGLNGVEKLAEAFRISGLDCSQIHPHLDKVSYWVQLTPGGIENSAFQHIERTNGQSPLANILDGFGSRSRARLHNHPAFQLLASNEPARSRGRPAPAFGIASAAPVASLEALRRLVREAINQRVPAGPRCPAPGSWFAPDANGWEYGVSRRSGARSVANDDYQISIKADGISLEVLNKRSGYTEITDTGRLQEVFRTFTAQAQPAAAAVSCSIEQVAAHNQGPACPPAVRRANAPNVTLNCPRTVLTAFQDLLQGTPILGTRMTSPYSGEVIILPHDAAQLTARHLQILARNERVNTTGVMNTGLYGGLLTEDQIARLRCLVKATNIGGIAYPEFTGGYGCARTPLAQPKTIVVDQSGLQWQGDLRNTGGMFFYPTNEEDPSLPPAYAAWQNDMYQAMYGAPRPPHTTPGETLPVTWNGVAGQLALDQVQLGIQSEFTQALDAVVNQAGLDAAIVARQVNFKFLKAGMGCFADGLGLSPAQTTRLEHARLLGIQRALENLVALPLAERQTRLSKIARIELPFSGGKPELAPTLGAIGALVGQLGLTWGGTPNEDAYSQRDGLINATTNCGDPHAMIGNEGGHQSVDASMATNAYLQHLNVAYNALAQVRLTHLAAPVAAIAPPAGPAQLAPVASLEVLRNLVREAINHRVPAGQECPDRGSWAAFDESGWEYGVSGRSGARSVANVNYQISIQADGTSLEVRDKRSGYTEITDAGQLQEVFRTFMTQAQPAVVAEAGAADALLARWCSLRDNNAALPPIQVARLLLVDYIEDLHRPEHREVVQDYIGSIEANDIACVLDLRMFLQSFKMGQIRREQWNRSDILARLIEFIENELERPAIPGFNPSRRQ